MRKDKIFKVIIVCTIICAVITVVLSIGDFVLGHILNIILEGEVMPDAGGSSIGIIGGSDGPTAIFATTSPANPTFAVVFGALTVVGIVLQLILKKKILS